MDAITDIYTRFENLLPANIMNEVILAHYLVGATFMEYSFQLAEHEQNGLANQPTWEQYAQYCFEVDPDFWQQQNVSESFWQPDWGCEIFIEYIAHPPSHTVDVFISVSMVN